MAARAVLLVSDVAEGGLHIYSVLPLSSYAPKCMSESFGAVPHRPAVDNEKAKMEWVMGEILGGSEEYSQGKPVRCLEFRLPFAGRSTREGQRWARHK